MAQPEKQTKSSTIVYNYEDKLREKKNGLPEKVYACRESVITVLFENPHLKTIHHLAIILFLGLCFITYTRGYLENNETSSGFRIVVAGFKNFHISILLWLFIYFLICCVYFAFTTWARLRGLFSPKSSTRRVYDMLGVIALFGYYIFSFKFMSHVIFVYQLPTGSAAFVLVEQTRLLMKIHAFVRSNAPKVLNFKEKSDVTLVLPPFRHFLFFTWIPALVYRDEYPRTSGIKWDKVTTYVLEISAAVFFYSFVLERFTVPIFKDFGLRKFSRSEIILAYLESVFPGILFLVVSFYLILHLVQNLFAELLCFGDRMFYKDWWTSTDYPTYYRKWNVIVHDWLYEYVYKDCYEILIPGSKNASKFVTFLLSSVVHEWIICNMFGYFLPVMFVQFFGVGTLMTFMKFPKNAVSNMFLWLSLALGSGILVTAHGLEFYARFNHYSSSRFDFYVPGLLTCDDCYLN